MKKLIENYNERFEVWCYNYGRIVIVCGLVILFFVVCSLFGCTNVTLQNGKSTAVFRGMKIFSPTVLSLQDGNCQVPSVDAGGLIQTPIITAATTTESCHTAVMTVNGVDLKGLANIIMTAILGGLAAS